MIKFPFLSASPQTSPLLSKPYIRISNRVVSNHTSFDQTTALAQWNKDHTGRLALPVHLSPLGWIRLPTTAVPFVNGSSDPTGGPNSPHIEFFFGAIRAQNDSAGIGNPPPLTTTRTATATIRPGDFLPSDIQSNVALSLSVVDLNPISRKTSFARE